MQQGTSQPLEHQSQSDTLMEEDIIVRDAKQPRLDFAILASMRLHSVDGSGRGSADRGPAINARLTPVIETIHEDEEEAAQQDDFAKATGTSTVERVTNDLAMSIELPSSPVAEPSTKPESPFALSQAHANPFRPSPQPGTAKASELRTSSDSVLLLDSKAKQATREGSDKKSPGLAVEKTRFSQRLRSRSTETEVSPRFRRLSPSKPRVSPKSRVTKSFHHRPPRARRRNFAVDFTNDPGNSKTMPV